MKCQNYGGNKACNKQTNKQATVKVLHIWGLSKMFALFPTTTTIGFNFT